MYVKTIILAIMVFLSCNNSEQKNEDSPEMWVTTFQQEALLKKLEGRVNPGRLEEELPLITVNSKNTYQSIDGFGFALTGGSALLIQSMEASARHELLKELFSRSDNGIGIDYLRISIGSSDLDPYPFTYNELATGQEDMQLEQFSISEDEKNLIPVLKEILAINPSLKIMGSPWTAPTWMKDSNSFIGGSLKDEYYAVYALYFVRYIEEMEKHGIKIDAITVQNEPLHDGNNPSMVMSAQEQLDFIKNHLGPEFERNQISTKIIIYDHNADRPDYPITILTDNDARKYIDGSAFHLYGGDISALSQVHQAHPDKNLYFTEQWVGFPSNFGGDLSWHMNNVIIGATRNWSRNVLQWNLAADENQDPHTEGGCDRCLGGITIEGNTITRNVGYYTIAHASKFIPSGSIRIESTDSDELPNVAFKTPDNKIVIIILNSESVSDRINISVDGEIYTASLILDSVSTIVIGSD